jgi:hypothetical protein
VPFAGFLRGLRRRAHAKEPELSFPFRKASRVAIVGAHFRKHPSAREFTLDDMPWMQAWAPDGLVLPLDLALALADQKQRGLFELPSLNTAIVVLTSVVDSPLADHHRDLLWFAFHVPIFEQLLGSAGHVIAAECEVHDGLHFCENEPFGFEGELVMDACACGRETPRLRSRVPQRTHAATA